MLSSNQQEEGYERTSGCCSLHLKAVRPSGCVGTLLSTTTQTTQILTPIILPDFVYKYPFNLPSANEFKLMITVVEVFKLY